MEVVSKLWTLSWSHILSHLSYFSGIGMLLPVIGNSWASGKVPWEVYPFGFWSAIAMIALGIGIIFYLERSLGRMFRLIGIMMIIPGMMAILLATVGSEAFFEFGRHYLPLFSPFEPMVEWMVDHNVPKSVNLGSAYLFVGLCFSWLGKRFKRLGNYL